MNETLVKKAIYDALRAIHPDLTVILADQNEPRPPRPYMSFKLITGPVREGWDWEEYVDDEDSAGESMTGVRSLTVSLNYFGTRALEAMARVQSRLQWSSIRAILADKNLVFVTDTGVRDLSQLLETQTETRSQMDVSLRLTVRDVDTGVGTIEHVEITDVAEGVDLIIP